MLSPCLLFVVVVFYVVFFVVVLFVVVVFVGFVFAGLVGVVATIQNYRKMVFNQKSLIPTIYIFG